ncbi:MAG TPA: ABC transporter substrate-binding protein, partial [Ilumatobacteraceae bacterium]|nr:ABC transporter substrate-binding protein [Ilumatobacteraceae bacterium]
MRSHTTRSGRTRRTFAVIVGLVALASVACGGDDDDDASSTASTDAASATDAPAATEAPAETDAPAATEPAADDDTATTAAGDEAPATMPAVEDHPQGGVLRYAAVAEPTTLDPHRGTSGGDHVSLYPIFDRLLNSNPETLEPEPFLATSWEFTDPQTLVMELQEGVMFTDGTPFDAAAVVYNVDRARTLENSSIKTDLSSIDAVEA